MSRPRYTMDRYQEDGSPVPPDYYNVADDRLWPENDSNINQAGKLFEVIHNLINKERIQDQRSREINEYKDARADSDLERMVGNGAYSRLRNYLKYSGRDDLP